MGLIELGGKCEVKELVKPDRDNRTDLENAINQVKSRPYRDASTPIAEAINKAARSIEQNKQSQTETARIVLVSDGESNCLKEEEYPLTPCEVVGSLHQRNIMFELTVIGYGVSQKRDKEFQCIASLSENYQYYSVNNPKDLTKVLNDSVKPPSLKSLSERLDNLTSFFNSIKGVIIAIGSIITIIVGIITAILRNLKGKHSSYSIKKDFLNDKFPNDDEYY